ncbi:unnamed protein product, partial [Prorocentrum cordatum]
VWPKRACPAQLDARGRRSARALPPRVLRLPRAAMARRSRAAAGVLAACALAAGLALLARSCATPFVSGRPEVRRLAVAMHFFNSEPPPPPKPKVEENSAAKAVEQVVVNTAAIGLVLLPAGAFLWYWNSPVGPGGGGGDPSATGMRGV